MVTVQSLVREELDRLFDVLPSRVAKTLQDREDAAELLEVVLDLGRLPEARFPSGDVELDDREVTREDLDYVVQRVGDFGDDNRAGDRAHVTPHIRHPQPPTAGGGHHLPGGTGRLRHHQNH